nr:MAG TPA: hypothetical protein [Caudoviricetes sp.]
MSIRVALKLGPVTKSLRFPYADVTITARRLRTPEWDSARDAAQAILRNDAELLNLLAKHDLLPKGGVRGWKRMKDNDPVAYAQYLIGIGMWLTAVECALVGVVDWTGIKTEDGAPAPIDRDILEVLLLDEALSDQVLGVVTEAAQLLIVEGEPFGASPSGSSVPEPTA